MKSQFLFFIFIAFCSQIVAAQITSQVFYVELKKGQTVSQNPIKEYHQESIIKADKKIVVYLEIQFQTIEGIVGAWNV
ncbi:hypothetical protein [Mariniflexile sp. AS56]|uniref:hypothetical protein n=1 Tax=Mariniflexile sp. AS56 TaxID=3063957 RepID=UPI0026E95950|nr:hypothetical protein [Mariniflexile sp. AS56]MDO7172523.1 hypothetical protein [Mariniflexile sp. AS56]